jgi:succinate-acetate transporter protein
MEVQQLLSTLQ